MGIIDQFTWTLDCKVCGISEQIQALDKGSAYGGSHWVGPPQPKNFVAKVIEGKWSPQVESATCKNCGRAASVARR